MSAECVLRSVLAEESAAGLEKRRGGRLHRELLIGSQHEELVDVELHNLERATGRAEP